MSSDEENYFIDANGKRTVLMLPPLRPLTKAVSRKRGKGAPPSCGRHGMDSILTAAGSPNKAVQIPLLRRPAARRISKYGSLSSSPPLLHNTERAAPHLDHKPPSSSPASNISGIVSNASRKSSLESNPSKISPQLIKQRTTVRTMTTTTTTTHTRKRGMNLRSHQKQIFITYFERGMTNGSSQTLAWREEARRITGLSLEQVGVCMFILG
jgi:hypothetical protein